jgi:hypothetical protein
MRSKSLVAGVVCAAAMLAIAGCGSSGSSGGGGSSGGTIKIGASVPLSGPLAGCGSFVKCGYQHAVNQVNAPGGITVDGKKLANGDISAIVAAQIGMGEEPLRDERGRPNNGRMAHICRDTPDGMVLRSRFWRGGGPACRPRRCARRSPRTSASG